MTSIFELQNHMMLHSVGLTWHSIRMLLHMFPGHGNIDK